MVARTLPAMALAAVLLLLAGCGGPVVVGEDLSFLERPLPTYVVARQGLYAAGPEERVPLAPPVLLPQLGVDDERIACVEAEGGNLLVASTEERAPLVLGHRVVGVLGGATPRGIAFELAPEGNRVGLVRSEGPPDDPRRSLYVVESVEGEIEARRLLELARIRSVVLWSRDGRALLVRRSGDFCPAGPVCGDRHADRVDVETEARTHVEVAPVGEPVPAADAVAADDLHYNLHFRYPTHRAVRVPGGPTVRAEGRTVRVSGEGLPEPLACRLPEDAPEIGGVMIFPRSRAVVFRAGALLYLFDLEAEAAGPIGPGYGVVVHAEGWRPVFRPGEDPLAPFWNGGVEPVEGSGPRPGPTDEEAPDDPGAEEDENGDPDGSPGREGGPA